MSGGGGSGDDIGPAVAAAAASGMSSPSGRYIRNFSVAPFLALQKANFFLTMLLLLSKYKMKSVQVVDLGEAKIDNVITQSAVIHMLEECAGLHLFESWGSKKLFELGLPIMKSTHIIKKKQDPNLASPSRARVYFKSRRHKEGRKYKTNRDAINKRIARLIACL
ncbi:hypothetical protein OROMI_006257 [Orobanche minor]